jgi:hypothetical protein
MPAKPQQPRVHSGKPRQHLRIRFVVLPAGLADQLYLPRVGHDRFVTKPGQFPADPRRVRSDFDGDPATRHGGNRCAISFFVSSSSAQLFVVGTTFTQHLASFV